MSKKFNYTPLQKVLSGSTLFSVFADHQIFFLFFSWRHYSHCICFPTFLKADTLCTGLTSTAYYREYENLSEHQSADIPAQSGTYCGVWSNWPYWQSISTFGQAGWLLVLLVKLAEYYYFWSIVWRIVQVCHHRSVLSQRTPNDQRWMQVTFVWIWNLL